MSSGPSDAARDERAQRELLQIVGQFCGRLSDEGIGTGYVVNAGILADWNFLLEPLGLQIVRKP